MDKTVKMNTKVEHLDLESVVIILRVSDLREFEEFVREKQIDGRKLFGRWRQCNYWVLWRNILGYKVGNVCVVSAGCCEDQMLADITEGIVKLWKPKSDAKKFISFIQDLKLNPNKYLEKLKNKDDMEIPLECQYQTVPSKRLREEQRPSTSMSSIEDILKRLVPAKSFLYRHQQKGTEKPNPSYLPMDGGRKPRKLFRLSYDYPQFDIFSRFSKQETFDDRGYYSVKSNNRFFIQKTYKRQESRTKYKSLSTPEELEKVSEDHFYEDLCYNDVNKNENKSESLRETSIVNIKTNLEKIQELFQSFRMPFFKKLETVEDDESNDFKNEKADTEKDTHLYENSDSVSNMYDSVRIPPIPSEPSFPETTHTKLPVEDYLEPVQLNKDYCSITEREDKRDDSLIGYIRSMFESRFGLRRVSAPLAHNLLLRLGDAAVDCLYGLLHCLTDVVTETNDAPSEDSEDEKPSSPAKCEDKPRHMADRPLPVPVENEPYYMNIDRTEAENLLLGQPDGTFVLRPSSQSTHAYTISVSCSNKVHNVGVRRRPDGRLALGFPRRGERSFASVTSLLRHHKRRRLMLVAGGGVIGTTTLNEAPQYYQMPSNLPVPKQ